MASRTVKSGGSLKARKGNGFEYDTAYSLQKIGYTVNRIDDNTKGIDLIAITPDSQIGTDSIEYYIECKFHKGFSWNKLIKIFQKTYETTKNINPDATPIFIFKSNQQPVLVMYLEQPSIPTIMEFKYFFGGEWDKRPKGYKLWK